MAINEEHRQLDIARELEKVARTLVHSTRTVPDPSQSYDLIGEIRATVSLLGQVAGQLATWHTRVVNGEHYAGEDPNGHDGAATTQVAASLKTAVTALMSAHTALDHAQTVNGRIRWYSDAPQLPRQSAYLGGIV